MVANWPPHVFLQVNQPTTSGNRPDPLIAGNRRFDGFYRIQLVDPMAGFSALMTYALNGVRRALDRNLIPVVDYRNHDVNQYFYDPGYGTNVWDYFFEPVMEVTPQALDGFLSDGEVSDELVFQDAPGQILEWHSTDPDRIATFWSSPDQTDPAEWMFRKRQLGRQHVERFITVKPHIMTSVSDFRNEMLAAKSVCGVHIRGTDFSYAAPTSLEKYFQEIHRLDGASHSHYDKIFLATDQAQFVTAFRREFGADRVVTYSAVRSNDGLPAFLNPSVSPYQKGEDVLIDILLLSRCNYLLKSAAAVGEYAMWFNPQLECTDFALSSSYDFTSSGSAYLKLNIGNFSSAKLHGLLFVSRVKQIVRRIFRPILDAGMGLGKKILPKPVKDFIWNRLFRHIY